MIRTASVALDFSLKTGKIPHKYGNRLKEAKYWFNLKRDDD